MIILTLFGTTTGLEVVQIPLAEIPASLKFDNSWIEITERQIVTNADNDAFVVFRKLIGSNIVTWIGLYRPAYEFGGSRSGCFYGAGAWLIGCVADVRALTETLRDLANQIQSTAMNGDRFVERISDVRSEIRVTSLASSLTSNLTKVDGGCYPSGDVAFIVSNGNVLEIIDWAQRSKSAYAFSKLFIGGADQVPGHSGPTSFVVHRSLSVAVEAAYVRLGNEYQSIHKNLNVKSDDLARTKLKLDKAEQNISELRAHIGELQLKVSLDASRIKELDAGLKHSSMQISGLTRGPNDQHQTPQVKSNTTSNVPIISWDDDFTISNNFPPNKDDNSPSTKIINKAGVTNTITHPHTDSNSDSSNGWIDWIVTIFLITFAIVLVGIGSFYIYNHFFKGAYTNCSYRDLSCTSIDASPVVIAPEVTDNASLYLAQWPFKPSCSYFPIKESWKQSSELCSENDSKFKTQTKEQNKTDKPRSRER